MNWLFLSPTQVAAVWAGLAGVALWALSASSPATTQASFHVALLGQRPADLATASPEASGTMGVAGTDSFLVIPLILALADPRLGFTLEGRSVVIVFDTSIWAQARPAGGAPLIDQEREETRRLLDTLPAMDRVLLLRADADAPPILPFTTDRDALRRAIAGVRASSGITDVPRALEIGRAALAGSRQGLLVYVGPGMLNEQQEQSLDEFRAKISSSHQVQASAAEATTDNGRQPQFLVRLVGDQEPMQNRGITHLSLRRDAAQPDHWHLLTQLKNYGDSKTEVVLKFSINDQPLGQRTVALGPNELVNTENEFTWDKGGLLQADISPSDDLEADNRAIVTLPTFRIVQVAVFTNSTSPFASDLLSVLSSNPYVRTKIVYPGTIESVSADVAIYQGTTLPPQSAFNSIWFLGGPSTAAARSLRITQWNSQHPVTRWIRTHDVSIRNPATLHVLPGDTVLAYTEGNPPAPLILAREQNGHRLLIIGFDPHDSNFPLESAFPLLMAGGIEWMTHSVEEAADSLSTGELNLPGPATRIISPSGRDVPFAREGADVHLLALENGIYRISGPNGETPVAVNIPLLPSNRLTASNTEAAGIEGEPFQPEGMNLWRWLLLVGIVALWVEWRLYYSSRERQRTAEIREIPGNDPSQHADSELEEHVESESCKPNFVAR